MNRSSPLHIIQILTVFLQAERSACDVNVLSIPVPIRRGGSESNLDVVDGAGHEGVGLDFTKGPLGIDSLQQKILKVGGDVALCRFSVCFISAVPQQMSQEKL